ncbi:hypothetical protein EV652_103424 [Kribbella steppae]|uniref:Uncharacterized protein n=1 Tax=Kribbella steppae TaxID=2512223 RepID=A0A4R2HQC3_9ACTN|nr:hypothetical protein [Kribbella steppae]TCO33423.1 hypothetical protein EV652_103424 [Kribbella steppae]
MPEQDPRTAPESLRAQVLSTEHWSLLATRSLAWSESFSRANWFVTVVSASVVALALVADSTDFGLGFRLFALLLIPLVIVIGLATVIRLVQLNSEDVHLVAGMNRLRRGYLDLAPEAEPYFITGHQEDVPGLMRTYGTHHTRIPAAQYLSSIAMLVSIIVALLIGALAGMVAGSFGLNLSAAVIIGLAAALTTLTALVLAVIRQVNHTWSQYNP